MKSLRSEIFIIFFFLSFDRSHFVAGNIYASKNTHTSQDSGGSNFGGAFLGTIGNYPDYNYYYYVEFPLNQVVNSQTCISSASVYLNRLNGQYYTEIQGASFLFQYLNPSSW